MALRNLQSQERELAAEKLVQFLMANGGSIQVLKQLLTATIQATDMVRAVRARWLLGLSV